MPELRPVRIPATAVIALALMVLACASGPSDTSDTNYTPTNTEPVPTAPKEAEPEPASRDKPPDRPWIAPEQTFLEAKSNDIVMAPGYPYAHYIELREQWKKSGRLVEGTHNSPPLVIEQDDGPTIYSEYTQTDDGIVIRKTATGFAIASYYPRFLQDDVFRSHSVTSPGTAAWMYFNRKAQLHGPCYENWEPGPNDEPVVQAVGAYAEHKRTGIWWECDETGRVKAVGEYRNGAQTGMWRFYGGTLGWLTDIQDETGGGNGMSQTYEVRVVSDNGIEKAGVILVRSGSCRSGLFEGDVTFFDKDPKWSCVIGPFHADQLCEGWWTYYALENRRRVRDEWRNAQGNLDGPVIEYDLAGAVTARSEYKNGDLVTPAPESK